ncbi:endospore germination permease [Paenibacillus sp. 5J-6]|uniref:Endospore germination permease n=1 Tax=Paenibacillus silvestris TaxID=2606219 RepID=A0A6L8V8Z4_9BACL|nr:endospore germination permease [Paenibacillus silvestris]MZQ86783.1 endospore germination permease [Paenibacillus silvestris]
MNAYDNAKISLRQLTILIILGIIGDSILILPTIIASSAKQDSWLSMIVATFLGFLSGWLFASMANKLQRNSLFDFTLQKLGRYVGGCFCLLFLFEFFICILSLLSEMSQFMTTQMMPETPVNAIIIVFLTVIIIAYRYGIEAFARMSELLFPMFMVLFLFLIIFLMPQVDFSNLWPIAAKGMSQIWRGSIPAFTYGFTEMVILLMLVSNVTGNAKLTKPIMTGFALGGVIMFFIVLLCVLVLGTNLMETKYYPTFVLAQKITIGHFLERLEVILAFLWIITVFYKTLLLFYSLMTGISQMLKLKENHMLTIPIGMILLVGTVVGTPSIIIYIDLLKQYYVWFDLSFCVLVPLLLFVLLSIVGRKKQGLSSSK